MTWSRHRTCRTSVWKSERLLLQATHVSFLYISSGFGCRSFLLCTAGGISARGLPAPLVPARESGHQLLHSVVPVKAGISSFILLSPTGPRMLPAAQ